MALGILVVLSISATAVIDYSTANQGSANLSGARTDAHSFAEAALNNGLAVINQASNAASPTLLGCTVDPQNVNNSIAPCTDITVPLAGGTALVHGYYTQGNVNTGTWTITATGTVRSRDRASIVAQVVKANVTVTAGGQANNIAVWNYLYSTAPQGSGCEVDLNGDHTTIEVPVYVTGDLCLSGDHAQIVEAKANGGQAVDIRVGGTVTLSGNHTTIGSSGTPLTSGYVGGGCITNSNATPHACTTTDNYFVSQADTALNATPPVTDFPGWYQNASPGPKHLCDTTLTPSPNLTAAGNQPGAFDGDTTMNGTNAQFNLTPTNSDYNCVTSTGTLKWNHSSHLLTIGGTMFFDGDVALNDGAAFYHGKATIYVNGVLSFNNGHGSAAGLRAGCPASPAAATKQCKFDDKTPSNGWDPNQDMIVFAVNKPSGVAVDLSVDHSEFQGDLLCPPTSTASLGGDHTGVEGGIICGKFLWADHTQVYPLPTITNLPPGAPIPPNAPATISPPSYTSG